MGLRKIKAYTKLLRIDSWQVWLFNFALGSILFALPQIDRFVLVLFSFSLATSGIFILNQYFDRKDDKNNNLKKDLPIASGDVPPTVGLILCYSFIVASLVIVFFAGISLFLLFIGYLFLGIGYSTPPFCFKNRPVLDVIVCGVGSGVLPFLIGLQTSSQLTLNFTLPWMVRRYQDALLIAIPIFLVQSAGQLFQVAGDYQADSIAKINTFAVKYGKTTTLRLANVFLLVTISLPIIYGVLNLSLTPYLSWYLIVFVFLAPCLLYLIYSLRDSSVERFRTLRNLSRRIGGVLLLILFFYVLVARIILNGAH